jgi:hypothetical protein
MVLIWRAVVSGWDQLQPAARARDFLRKRDANWTQIWKRQIPLERGYLIKESVADIGGAVTEELRIEPWRLEVHIRKNDFLSCLGQIQSKIGARKSASDTALIGIEGYDSHDQNGCFESAR